MEAVKVRVKDEYNYLHIFNRISKPVNRLTVTLFIHAISMNNVYLRPETWRLASTQ